MTSDALTCDKRTWKYEVVLEVVWPSGNPIDNDSNRSGRFVGVPTRFCSSKTSWACSFCRLMLGGTGTWPSSAPYTRSQPVFAEVQRCTYAVPGTSAALYCLQDSPAAGESADKYLNLQPTQPANTTSVKHLTNMKHTANEGILF